MIIKSSYDTEYYAEIDDIDDNTVKLVIKLVAKLDEAYLKGFEAGKYLYSSNGDISIHHECTDSDIRNLITEESFRYLYSPLDIGSIFDLKNDICYWMDILMKSGSLETFEVNVYTSEDDNTADINVIYTDNDHKEHSIRSEVAMGAFN